LHNTGRLAGRKALVTGSGTGIGREIALEFAREGADVVLHYAHSEEGAQEAAMEIQNMGRKAVALKANFEVVEDVVRMGKEAIEFLGGIDALVNNSGITFNKPFFEVTLDQFNTLYFVNIRAQFFLTQYIAHHMVKNEFGTVCNMTSVHGLEGASEHTVYSGTKGAIIAYTRSLAVELAHQGVRVNAIAPGAILVENSFKVIPGLTDEAVRKTGWRMVPNARIGNPSDIAKLAVFLTSYDSDYIVGQTIVADGGSTALLSLAPDFRSRSEATFGKGYVPDV